MLLNGDSRLDGTGIMSAEQCQRRFPMLFFYLPLIIFQAVLTPSKRKPGASEPFNLDSTR